MTQIFQKSLLKWSTIALLGISAYFVGYFWGMKNLNEHEKNIETQPPTPSEDLQQPGELRELNERVH